jgi:predicted amidohydrolase
VTTSTDPSDLLVELVAAILALEERVGEGARALLADAESRMTSNGNVEAWTFSARGTLDRRTVATARRALPDLPADPEVLATVLEAIQVLDQWHAPAVPDLSGERKVANPDQVERSTRLASLQWMNANVDRGLLIPRQAGGWRSRPEAEIRRAIERDYEPPSGGWLSRHMTCCAVLPAQVPASHPDNGEGEQRFVRVRYRSLPAAEDVPGRVDGHRIMVAPILEGPDDVRVARDGGGGRYLVRPAVMMDRVEAVVERAYAEEVSVLLMPEMALCGDTAAHLRRVLDERFAAHCEKELAPPALRYVMAGVCESAAVGSRNHVLVMSAEGGILADQDKLSRWNLSPDEQLQLGLGASSRQCVPRLDEAIDPATALEVIDLAGIGRLAVLICADMQISQPGDWLYAGSGVDLVYAPIMDKTCPPRRERGNVGPWIVARSHRAAVLSRARVVVTNSMSLTHHVNRSNEERGLASKYPPRADCDIALMLDGATADVAHRSLVVRLGSSDVAETASWDEGCEPFFGPTGD